MSSEMEWEIVGSNEGQWPPKVQMTKVSARTRRTWGVFGKLYCLVLIK